MTAETEFADIVPVFEDAEAREAELMELGSLSRGPRVREPGSQGDWELVDRGGMVFSAPHEVPHLRDGTEKAAESGTGALAFALAAWSAGSAIVTVPPQAGDPNWDPDSPFVKRVRSLARNRPTIDLHMMRPRGIEVCIGLGPNPLYSSHLWRAFMDELVAAGLRASINWPFGASPKTVTGQLHRTESPAIQLELSWDCFDSRHPAMRRAWTALARASRRLAADL